MFIRTARAATDITVAAWTASSRSTNIASLFPKTAWIHTCFPCTSGSLQIFPKPKADQRRHEYFERRRSEAMESANRWGDLNIPDLEVATMSDSEFLSYRGERRVRSMALRHEIFQNVFHKIFISKKNFALSFGNIGLETTVYRGNILSPSKMSEYPTVHFQPEDDTLFTILFMDADGRMDGQTGQLAHWLVTNVSDPSTISEKENVVIPYMQPTPPKGTGYHRIVAVLYQQQSGPVSINLSRDDSAYRDAALSDRYIVCTEMESKYHLKPVGLAFSQAIWDSSVDDTFTKQFGITAPIFSQYQC